MDRRGLIKVAGAEIQKRVFETGYNAIITPYYKAAELSKEVPKLYWQAYV